MYHRPNHTASPADDPSPRRLAAARWGSAVASAVLVAAAVTTTSRAAFSAATANGPNNAGSGTVAIADTDSNSLIIDLSGMKPGDTSGDKCVNVNYTGSLTADVHLYGSASTTTLAPYLNLTIDISTGATGGATLDCTNFDAGASVNLFTNTLEDFLTNRTDFASGLAGWDGATNPSTRSYRFRLTLQDDNNAQNKSANPTFTWEAQNT